MKLVSEKALVQANNEEIIEFLSDANNLFHLIPKDKISDWEADENQCSFKVQGGITITLVENGNEAPNKVFLKSGEKSPFPFNLIVHLKNAEMATEGYIEFDGEVNMFLKMMVEKPLLALFNYMTERLQAWYENKDA